jgi:hypothetical protein
MDPTGWLVSERPKGIRVLWNGANQLSFANGREVKAPKEFTQSLPKVVVDGYLIARSSSTRFQDIVSILYILLLLVIH